MQPYFFPYIGQFQLIQAVDRFILCDDVQYIRHGWINRNRILKPCNGDAYQYIIVPVAKHCCNTPIRDIKVSEAHNWKETIFRQLEYYRKAPYFATIKKLLCHCLSTEETNIARLNGNCLKAVCDYIGIPFTIELSSGLNLDYSNVINTEDWAITICEQLDAHIYYNPPGGMDLYKKEDFRKKNIELHFVKPHLNEYDQNRTDFIPGLSIIDVMMFNNPAQIRCMLNEYQLV
jgi:hypothetical protein